MTGALLENMPRLCGRERGSIPAQKLGRFRPSNFSKRRQILSEHPSCWLGTGQMRILAGTWQQENKAGTFNE